MESTVPGYVPLCETSGLSLYPDETRVAVGGSGGYLVLSLPPDLTSGVVYGGTSGNSLLAILTLQDSGSDADGEVLSEELARTRTSTVRVGAVGDDVVELGLWLTFDVGEVTGAQAVPILE